MHRNIIRRATVGALAATTVCGTMGVAQEPPPHDMSNMAAPRRGPPDPLGVSMERMGSGTTWIPDALRVPSVQAMVGGWHLVGHGFLFAQYNRQGGTRGAGQVGALNWVMLMASHGLAGGRVQVRTMLSLDAATVTARGYPLLLQTGETWQGQPLHDRQHPHDLWMELGVLYERPVTSAVGISLFVAPSGEPALGPVAFMHRPSAMDDPVAPLSHHWQDATHIVFGVVTAGLFGHRWKLEGSAFNGREPDERRWNLERIRLNSYAGRLTVNPSDHVSLTIGQGYLRSPEALDPGGSMHRTTASVLYGRSLRSGRQLAAALVWGSNGEGGERTHAILAEAEAVLDRHNTMFGRVEVAEKHAEDLVLPVGPGGVAPGTVFTISSLSLGYVREVARASGATLGLGVRGTVNILPEGLSPYYGSRTPLGGLLYLRLRPVHRARPSMPGMTM